MGGVAPVGHMLGGDTGLSGEMGGACNDDPYVTPKDANCHRVVTGPHVTLMGPPSKELGYTEASTPDTTKPVLASPQNGASATSLALPRTVTTTIPS